jgi:hypothetical protein
MQMLTLLKSQKTEDFETITGFPASIGACPSLGDDNPMFLTGFIAVSLKRKALLSQ